MFDSAAQAFQRPFVSLNTATCIRELVSGVSEEARRHAKDFTLYRVGRFDQATGKIAACTPEQILVLSDLEGIAIAADLVEDAVSEEVPG